MTEPTLYEGDDLEAMAFTVNYQRWIMAEFAPFIGGDVVEVGAGTGTFSEHLLARKPKSLSLVEPSTLFPKLQNTVRQGSNGDSTVGLFNTVFREAAAEIAAAHRPDTIIYINVLEHIEDDRGELAVIRDTLSPGGHVLIFVPALMSLYTDFDKMIGHFRRYVKPELEAKVRDAGFDIVKSTYFDMAGIVPWYLKFKILRSQSLNVAAVKAYDTLAIPFVRGFEALVPVPLGKNILLVGRKC